MIQDRRPPTTDPHGETAPPKSGFSLDLPELVLFFTVLVFYAVTRLYGIEDFPIYFFCDEAQQANQASHLVENGFRDNQGNLLPAYFQNVRVYNLGLSVYVHALPVTLLGKSIVVVRGTSVAVGLLGVAALMLALKWFFSARLWWAGGLVMAALPAWFLHSRTAFETVMMVSFYATFVLAYLLYRKVSPRWLPLAVVAGAATFYSYSNGQGVMFVTCLLLLITDWRYHWRVIRTDKAAFFAALATLVLVAFPYLHFRFVLHPEMMSAHFADLDSYWFTDIPLSQKVATFVTTWLTGMGPGYWFTEDVTELARHRMLGYPHLPLWSAPLIAIGLGLSLWRSRRSPAYRLVLIAILAAPFSASLVELRITRVLAMMVPATLLATVGLDRVGRWVERWVPKRAFSAAVGLILAAATVTMARDALVHGALWFRDYGMHGMQWGAKQLFTEVDFRLEHAPDAEFTISHYWGNNPATLAEFFLDKPLLDRIHLEVIDDFLYERRERLNPRNAFVLTRAEYDQALANPKIEVGDTYSAIPYPDGTPGFYITRLAYTPEADSIFEIERAARRELVESTIEIGGAATRLRHPRLDQGEISNAFDGDERTLARTLDANPTQLEFFFSTPRPVSCVRLHLWGNTYSLEFTARHADGTESLISKTARGSEFGEPIVITFPERFEDVETLTMVIARASDAHIHLREIEIVP